MNKQVYRQDMIAAVVIIMVGVAAFILSLVMPGKASMFPKIVSSGLMVLGVLLIFDSIRKIRKDMPPMRSRPGWVNFRVRSLCWPC